MRLHIEELQRHARETDELKRQEAIVAREKAQLEEKEEREQREEEQEREKRQRVQHWKWQSEAQRRERAREERERIELEMREMSLLAGSFVENDQEATAKETKREQWGMYWRYLAERKEKEREREEMLERAYVKENNEMWEKMEQKWERERAMRNKLKRFVMEERKREVRANVYR